MRDVWVSTGESPTVYRYIDWLLTVPLQMIEFYLILAAVGRYRWYLLETINWYINNACRWIPRRSWIYERNSWFRHRYGWLDLYSL